MIALKEVFKISEIIARVLHCITRDNGYSALILPIIGYKIVEICWSIEINRDM